MTDDATENQDATRRDGSRLSEGLGLPAEASLTTHELALRFDTSAAWLLNGTLPSGPLVGAGAYLEAATRLRRLTNEVERLRDAVSRLYAAVGEHLGPGPLPQELKDAGQAWTDGLRPNVGANAPDTAPRC